MAFLIFKAFVPVKYWCAYTDVCELWAHQGTALSLALQFTTTSLAWLITYKNK